MSDLPELNPNPEQYTAAGLEGAVTRLRAARHDLALWEETLKEKRAEFDVANALLLAALALARALVTGIEQHVREVALAVWMDGYWASKTVRPGVGIRETTVVDYDDAVAFAWAKESGLCLTLEAATFKKLAANDVAGVLPAGLATVSKVATVTIGKDLP